MALQDYPSESRRWGHCEIERVLVYANHPLIARPAFRAAVEQYPNSPGIGDGGTCAEMKAAKRPIRTRPHRFLADHVGARNRGRRGIF
jgi:hypothetical protein